MDGYNNNHHMFRHFCITTTIQKQNQLPAFFLICKRWQILLRRTGRKNDKWTIAEKDSLIDFMLDRPEIDYRSKRIISGALSGFTLSRISPTQATRHQIDWKTRTLTMNTVSREHLVPTPSRSLISLGRTKKIHTQLF